MTGVPASKAQPPLKGGAENRPDYSRAMLRLFIEGAVMRERIDTDAAAAPACRLVRDRLSETARLPRETIVSAHAGRLIDAPARAAIWGALGIVVDRDLGMPDKRPKHDRGTA